MYSHIVICTLLAITGPLLAVSYGEKDETEFDPTYIRDPLDGSRIKRSWLTFAIKRAVEGYKAKSQLLKGAYPIFTKMKRTSSYVKPGDYKTALADFEGVNPTNVRNLVLTDGVNGWRGVAGDRIITIEHEPKSGRVAMKITKGMGTKKERTNHILYVEILSQVNGKPSF